CRATRRRVRAAAARRPGPPRGGSGSRSERSRRGVAGRPSWRCPFSPRIVPGTLTARRHTTTVGPMTSIVDGYAKIRRCLRPGCERLVELGIFVGERLELLDGALVVREPQGSRHAAIVGQIGEVLRAAFGEGWHVRLQTPLALDDESEPEPDVAVVA